MIIETAHAKINFTLSVGSKRADGYHSIDSLMHSISLSDRITLTKAETITLSVTEGEAPLGRENLMVRAAERFFEETGLSGGVSMTLSKRIPSEAGMGGGSSDAATTLLALNKLWNLRLSTAELQAIGVQLGADVPFFLCGTNAWVEGIGDIISPLKTSYGLPSTTFLVVKPQAGLDTKTIFSHPDLKRNSDSATIASFAADHFGFGQNNLQTVAQNLCPEVNHAIAWLSSKGLQGKMTYWKRGIKSISRNMMITRLN